MKILFYGPSAADIRLLEQLYAIGDHNRLSEQLLSHLKHYEDRGYLSDATFSLTLFPFLDILLTLFATPDFVLPEKYVPAFIRYNTLLSNLVAISPWHTTDTFLKALRTQPRSLAKILTLYSARNHEPLDVSGFFAENAPLSSLWYFQYCGIHISGLALQEVVGHAAAHLRIRDERLQPAQGMMNAYYGSTYIDGEGDRAFKQFLNKVVQRHQAFRAESAPDPKKIAVISDLWYPAHSVHRNYSAYVKSLKGHYHLTLFHTITPREELDTSMFDEVRRLDMSNRESFFGPLSDHFQLAYFPDVGMTDASIVLSNCRIAPVQLCSPGHSVSTWGSEIDYFISGADVEIPDAPEWNYSERLVLLPGMGAIHNRPQYKPGELQRSVHEEIIINCPWSGQKVCARFLGVIRELLERIRRPVRLRILPNDGVTMYNGYLPFLADLRTVLEAGVHIDVLPGLPYVQYMALMEEGDLTLDSFHFAGCNTVADSLFLRKPTLVWEGDKWYNRIGPAMLRLIGMEECIAVSEEEYLHKATELIHDDTKRKKVSAKLAAADLDSELFGTADAPAFRRAVDYLIANHSHLQKTGEKSPVIIK